MKNELPSSVPSPLGPVRVLRASAKKLGSKKDAVCYGDFCWAKRRIRVRQDLRGAAAWQVFFHEWTHMILADAGLTACVPRQAEELICDAVSNGLAMFER